jgi:hypothetical protein
VVLVAPLHVPPLQQSTFVAQAAPARLQHRPLLQAPMKQVAAVVHAVPEGAPHPPNAPSVVHASPPQQSAFVTHAPPPALKLSLQHTPPLHAPMRHVAAVEHTEPEASPHTICVPTVVQGRPPAHWDCWVHRFPTGS